MILIVDDKPENIFSLKKTLELHNLEVDSALSGEEALKKILKNVYELIILDVQMPGMDGYEVAEAISGYSKARDIPILFLSAVNKDKKFITKGYTAGGMDYITKPVDPDILLLKVQNFCRLYRQTQELHATQQALRAEIEQRKLAQAGLREHVQELHSILESLPLIAFTAKADGQLEFVNQHWLRFAPSEKDYPQSHPDDIPLKTALTKAITTGMPVTSEVRICNLANKDYEFHLLRLIPVREDGRITKWVGTLTDIDIQKRTAEVLEQKVEERTRELLDTNRQLEESNYELQQFASVASHDLKEPLRKIQIFSSIIQEKLSGENDQLTDYIGRITSSAGRMTGLINDLLDFSKLSEKVVFSPTDLTEVVRLIITDLEIQIAEKAAVIDLEPLPVIEVVPGQIRQVFQNLISNAIKFSRAEAAPRIRITGILVAGKDPESPADPLGGWCRITVTDNGIGFNEKYVDKIFTIFQRLHGRERYEGTGIGLAITRKIIEKHGGTITARSREGDGSAFIILLPARHSTQVLSNTDAMALEGD